MYLAINKCVTAVKISNFSGHYLRNRSTLDIGVLGYIGVVQHKEHSREILSIPPGTPCISIHPSFAMHLTEDDHNSGRKLYQSFYVYDIIQFYTFVCIW